MLQYKSQSKVAAPPDKYPYSEPFAVFGNYFGVVNDEPSVKSKLIDSPEKES